MPLRIHASSRKTTPYDHKKQKTTFFGKTKPRRRIAWWDDVDSDDPTRIPNPVTTTTKSARLIPNPDKEPDDTKHVAICKAGFSAMNFSNGKRRIRFKKYKVYRYREVLHHSAKNFEIFHRFGYTKITIITFTKHFREFA